MIEHKSRLHRSLSLLSVTAFILAGLIVAGCKGYGKPPTKDEAATKASTTEAPKTGTAADDD